MMVSLLLWSKDGTHPWIVFYTIYGSHCEMGWGDLRDVSKLKIRV
ncbi:hypothetical protein BM1374166_01460 [Bartonella tribocorum]|nr:hypothetical protein BM1374166_01460 [Bartonella tribocorum]